MQSTVAKSSFLHIWASLWIIYRFRLLSFQRCQLLTTPVFASITSTRRIASTRSRARQVRSTARFLTRYATGWLDPSGAPQSTSTHRPTRLSTTPYSASPTCRLPSRHLKTPSSPLLRTQQLRSHPARPLHLHRIPPRRRLLPASLGHHRSDTTVKRTNIV